MVSPSHQCPPSSHCATPSSQCGPLTIGCPLRIRMPPFLTMCPSNQCARFSYQYAPPFQGVPFISMWHTFIPMWHTFMSMGSPHIVVPFTLMPPSSHRATPSYQCGPFTIGCPLHTRVPLITMCPSYQCARFSHQCAPPYQMSPS